MLCNTAPFFGVVLNLPVFLAELCRQQAEHILKTWLSCVECALGMSSGKDFICQLAVRDSWVSKKEMLSLRNI